MSAVVSLGEVLDELLVTLEVEDVDERCEGIAAGVRCGNRAEWLLSCPHAGDIVIACGWHVAQWKLNVAERFGTCVGCRKPGFLDTLMARHWTLTPWSRS